jgi:hypothetical protein
VGTVTSQPIDDTWAVFRDCGVENIVIDVFRRQDAEQHATASQLWSQRPGAQPIRSSAPTRTTGEWSVAVPRLANSSIVLIARAVQGQRSFVQSHVYPVIPGRRTQFNFHDVTTRDLTLSIHGGRCLLDIGRATPTFVHEGCGSRKASMTGASFGLDPRTYSNAPAVQFVVKMWDPAYTAWFKPKDSSVQSRQQVHEHFDKHATIRADVRVNRTWTFA